MYKHICLNYCKRKPKNYFNIVRSLRTTVVWSGEFNL